MNRGAKIIFGWIAAFVLFGVVYKFVYQPWRDKKADELIAMPNVALGTERRFVVNTFLALGVCEDTMREVGATNFGFGRCMGPEVIGMRFTAFRKSREEPSQEIQRPRIA